MSRFWPVGSLMWIVGGWGDGNGWGDGSGGGDGRGLELWGHGLIHGHWGGGFGNGNADGDGHGRGYDGPMGLGCDTIQRNTRRRRS